MTAINQSTHLEVLQKEYQTLLAQLTRIGPIKKGTLAKVYNRCLSGGCRCHKGNDYRHGPYWQWSGCINGKNRSRRVYPEELKLYREFIDNRRAFMALSDRLLEVGEAIFQGENAHFVLVIKGKSVMSLSAVQYNPRGVLLDLQREVDAFIEMADIGIIGARAPGTVTDDSLSGDGDDV